MSPNYIQQFHPQVPLFQMVVCDDNIWGIKLQNRFHTNTIDNRCSFLLSISLLTAFGLSAYGPNQISSNFRLLIHEPHLHDFDFTNNRPNWKSQGLLGAGGSDNNTYVTNCSTFTGEKEPPEKLSSESAKHTIEEVTKVVTKWTISLRIFQDFVSFQTNSQFSLIFV